MKRLYCILFTNPRSSKSRKVVVSTVFDNPGMAFLSSPKRMVSFLPNSNNTHAFHFP